MSVQTHALVCITFGNHTTFNSKWDVERYIQEQQELIDLAKSRIRSLAMMTEPQKFCPPDEDPMCFVQNTLDEMLELLDEATCYKDRAELVLSEWDNMVNSNGHPLYKKGVWEDQESYQCLRGDFVKMYDENDKVVEDPNDI